MSDLIERKAAIDALDCISGVEEVLRSLPSAQPVDKDTNVLCTDTISRQAEIDEIEERKTANGYRNVAVISELNRLEGYIMRLPSAQPEQTNSWCINSWCINCKEYDTENKCCHRYNRVIKQTLDEVYAHAETEAEARFHDEIVRCKDCTFYRSDGCFFSTAEVGEDGFCSWGRKENR